MPNEIKNIPLDEPFFKLLVVDPAAVLGRLITREVVERFKQIFGTDIDLNSYTQEEADNA